MRGVSGYTYRTKRGWRWVCLLPNGTSQRSPVFYTRRWSAWRGMRRFMRQVEP